MAGFKQSLVEQHNESRHKQKHREHAAYDAFRQNETQIITKAELHQHQSNKSRNRCQA